MFTAAVGVGSHAHCRSAAATNRRISLVTAPSPSSPPVSPAVPPVVEPLAPVRVPLGWLLDHGSIPVRARALLELTAAGDDVRAARAAVYAHGPAIRLALQQERDGTFGGRMLAINRSTDNPLGGIGTIPAVRRLVEYGWEPESPPLQNARRILFRLLAEDADPSFLYELRADAGQDENLIRRGRGMLREGAAAALAQLGCEADPRLRGAAVRALDRAMAYVKQATAAGAEPPSGPLPMGATPPSAHFLVMLAYMPRFRSEHQDEMARLYAYLSAAAPGGVPRQLVGKKEIQAPHLVLGDPLGHVSESTWLPSTLAWLEVLARLGFVKHNAAWSALLDRLLDERDAKGVWLGRTTALATPEHPWDWPTFPLGDPGSRESLVADMTFRLALVAKLAGRTLDLG